MGYLFRVAIFADDSPIDRGIQLIYRTCGLSLRVTERTWQVDRASSDLLADGVNKGGLELSVKNMRAFMPAGQGMGLIRSVKPAAG